MIDVMKFFFKKLFHEHDYIKIGYRLEEDRYERYSIRNYRCSECGKEIWVDGRMDWVSKN